ncbi:ead/Ea22-like family protein [Salmonella enterica subsp. enterica serovar Meleagridis]|uniref:Ead/Ea22-like family protein n=1 Tax=Salmonella enterica subsp. enterica serovar Uganda TaxID=487004 RepID=A0A5Z6FGV5_SALET|nr:ead/Ea22-like family protein [Salmonella enterica]EAA8790685.1 ead/Ea22-like family protein [Salmonella enterica subsp. enterica]EBL3463023.1 ead/Ea22-like family protein [Salmonella enterica subsp. enterica serovar Muenster]EBX1225028.1 ead/Ea22-like family protein [Salmonella enterica subsp. enterica serovar Anatum]EDA9983238.1 ead/Ea22-like family protein [Salmonella enterica subsp. enterica serovar Enteritidis]EGA4892852.1 ead/Ea22-like family protein [Salmonella enterica subsp. enteric
MSNIDKQALRERYSPQPAPECHICGKEMTIQRMSARRITYCCTGATYDDKGCHYAEGRSIADDHYEQSRVTVVDVSDPDVLALLDELEHYKSREERVTNLVLDNSTSWDALYKKLEAAERRIAEQSTIVAAAEKLVRCKGRYHSELNYRALAKLFGVITPDLPPLEHENVHYADAAEVEITALRQRIAELEAKLETADKLQDSAFRHGLQHGFSYGQTNDQAGFEQCMAAYSTRAGIGVKQQDSVGSDVGGRNQPGMVVAIHIDAGDFVKVKGQVFEVEETDFDDHDVTLWFVGGNALKCAAGCPVEVVSEPVAAGIKVKGE